MSTQLVFDQEAARRIELIYLIGDAARRRRIVREALAASAGERILDVGCGPGFYCVELLEDVGPSGSVVGVDSSAAMLALAARRCAGFDNIELQEADATALPVEDGGFDAAISVQVQEYVRDIDAGLAELHRSLRPGGRVLVFDIDWETLSVHGEPRLSRRVLDAWDEHLAHRSLPRTLAPAAGVGDGHDGPVGGRLVTQDHQMQLGGVRRRRDAELIGQRRRQRSYARSAPSRSPPAWWARIAAR